MAKSKRYRKKHGIYTKFKPREVWDMKTTFSQFMLPRLRYFRDHTDSYPVKRPISIENSDYRWLTKEEWHEVLNTIIWSLEQIAEDEPWTHHMHELLEEGTKRISNQKLQAWQDRIQLGLDNLAIYFQDLWW